MFLSFFFSKYLGAAPKRPRLCMAGGGGEKKCTQIICRKYFSDKINLPAYFLINRGRWVYEGGGLEQKGKNSEGINRTGRESGHYT